jgi:hypothetical protein
MDTDAVYFNDMRVKFRMRGNVKVPRTPHNIQSAIKKLTYEAWDIGGPEAVYRIVNEAVDVLVSDFRGYNAVDVYFAKLADAAIYAPQFKEVRRGYVAERLVKEFIDMKLLPPSTTEN